MSDHSPEYQTLYNMLDRFRRESIEPLEAIVHGRHGAPGMAERVTANAERLSEHERLLFGDRGANGLTTLVRDNRASIRELGGEIAELTAAISAAMVWLRLGGVMIGVIVLINTFFVVAFILSLVQ